MLCGMAKAEGEMFDVEITVKQEPLDVVNCAGSECQTKPKLPALKEETKDAKDEQTATMDEIYIKDEPIDHFEVMEVDDIIECSSMSSQGGVYVKSEMEDSESSSFKIIDEQPGIITVSANDLEDNDEEITFFECLKSNATTRKRSTPKQSKCKTCLQVFSTQSAYETHLSTGHCLAEGSQKCVKCPLRFKMDKDLSAHIDLHKRNLFFCAELCGKSFTTLVRCQEHEMRDHKKRNMRCYVCNYKFNKSEYLINHMQIHTALKRFVCSHCRSWYTSWFELSEHWQLNKECGLLMKTYVPNRTDEREEQPPTSVSQKRLGSSRPAPLKKLPRPTENRRLEVPPLAPLSFPGIDDILVKQEIDVEEPPLQTVVTPSYTEIDAVDIKTELETVIEIKEESIMEVDVPANQVAPTKESSGNNVSAQILKLSPNAATKSIVNITPNFTLQTIPSPNALAAPAIATVLPSPFPMPIQLPRTTVANPNKQQKSTSFNINLLQNSKFRVVKMATPPTIIKTEPLDASDTTAKQNPPKLNGSIQFQKKFNVFPINLQNCKIVKLAPNAKIVRLPAQVQAKATSPKGQDAPPKDAPTEGQSAIVGVNLSPKPAADLSPKTTNNGGTFKLKVVPMDRLLETPIKAEPLPVEVKTEITEVLSPEKQRGLETAALIERKLLDEAMAKARLSKSKNLCLTKETLNVIESLPQKRELIENMIEEVKKAIKPGDGIDELSFKTTEVLKTTRKQKLSASNVSSDAISETSMDTVYTCDMKEFNGNQEEPPQSFFVPMSTKTDPELLRAQKENPNYRFLFACPQCPRCYEHKPPFRVHLLTEHSVPEKELNKMVVEVKTEEIISTFADSGSIVSTESSQDDSSNHSTKTKSKSRQRPEAEARRRDHVCPKCGRVCSSRTMLSDHVRANCSRTPQYSCALCSKSFFSASTLSCHKTIHTGVLPFQCNFCTKRFRTRGQVTVHHRTHTGERPFVCQICSQGFTHRETLISHLSRHIGMKRYKCYGCNKHFSCISGLKTHRDIRPETCGRVKLNSRAVGPRVRVVRGKVSFEPQPDINPYLRTEDPHEVLAEIQNHN